MSGLQNFPWCIVEISRRCRTFKTKTDLALESTGISHGMPFPDTEPQLKLKEAIQSVNRRCTPTIAMWRRDESGFNKEEIQIAED